MDDDAPMIPPADWNEIPLAMRPDGTLLYEYSLLPDLPSPARIVIGKDHIEIDGWVFAYHLISKALLLWMQVRFQSWIKADPSPENRAWLNGCLDAFVTAITDASARTSR